MQKTGVSFNQQVRQCYMYDIMKQQTINFINNIFASMNQQNPPDDNYIARNIKERMDQLFGPPWHCFVGRGFGSSVTYKNKHFIYMYIANRAIMLYKH